MTSTSRAPRPSVCIASKPVRSAVQCWICRELVGAWGSLGLASCLVSADFRAANPTPTSTAAARRGRVCIPLTPTVLASQACPGSTAVAAEKGTCSLAVLAAHGPDRRHRHAAAGAGTLGRQAASRSDCPASRPAGSVRPSTEPPSRQRNGPHLVVPGEAQRLACQGIGSPAIGFNGAQRSSTSTNASPSYSVSRPGASPGSGHPTTSTSSNSGSSSSSSKASISGCNSRNATRTRGCPRRQPRAHEPPQRPATRHMSTPVATCTTPVALDNFTTPASELRKRRDRVPAAGRTPREPPAPRPRVVGTQPSPCRDPTGPPTPGQLRRRDVLGGLIHQYQRAA